MTTTPLERRAVLRSAIEKLNQSVRWRALNAMDGIDRALALLEIDREMASFRAMTAQEEAAAAVFNALKIRAYPGAERLNLGSHRHKWALWLVVDAARMAVGRTFQNEWQFTVRAQPPSVELRCQVKAVSTNHPAELDDHWIVLPDPLSMHHRVDGAPNLFAKELREVAEANGHEDIERHLKLITNQRNVLLYATDSGLPASQATIETLEARRTISEIGLYLAIAILQSRDLQAYALQALEALLVLVAKADAVIMPYPELDPDAIQLTIPRPQPDIDASDP